MQMWWWSQRWVRRFSPNAKRGIFKTTDGGKTWRKMLYKDDVTGAIDVVFADDNTKVGYAAVWHHKAKPGDDAGPDQRHEAAERSIRRPMAARRGARLCAPGLPAEGAEPHRRVDGAGREAGLSPSSQVRAAMVGSIAPTMAALTGRRARTTRA